MLVIIRFYVEPPGAEGTLEWLSTDNLFVHGQLVEPAVCLSDLYDVFLLNIVRDTMQSLWHDI